MNKKLLEYYNGDELAASVWKNKYAAKGEKTPKDTNLRMAKEFFRIESQYIKEEFKFREENGFKSLSTYGQERKQLDLQSIIDLFYYIIPQGRIKAGLGVLDYYRSLSNCLRLPPPKDSYSSILYTDTMLVNSAKRGCGYGIGLSNLRPEGTEVSNAAKTSTGASSFMERYSFSTREVAQKGRRGACLLDIDIKHPDSLTFINAKKDKTKITGANISIKLNNEFIQAVENDEDYILRFPCDKKLPDADENDYETFLYAGEYNTLFETQGMFFKKIRAKEYWNTITKNAWENAEPGVFYWNKMIDYDPSNVYKEYIIDGTNACGEQPMPVYDTCRLLCANLTSFVLNAFTNKTVFNADLFYKMCYEQIRLGDTLVDLELEYIQRILDKVDLDDLPLKEKQIEIDLWANVYSITKKGRRIGCGITALGDMLAMLRLKYDSPKALDFIDKIMSIKMRAELDCTIDLAILRGPFEGWDRDLEYEIEYDEFNEIKEGKNDFYQFLLNKFPEQVERMIKHGRRHVNWSTIAPVGTTSLVEKIHNKYPNMTSGCEPLFYPFYMRRKKVNPGEKDVKIDFVDELGDSWQEYPVLMGGFKLYLESTADYKEQFFHGFINSVEDFNKETLESLFKQSPYYNATANDINWKKRIEIQSILQKYTTSAISSTINLPNDISKEEVSNIYMLGWKNGLKGVTIYRDGSRTGVLINENTKINNFKYIDAAERPKTLDAEGHTITSNKIKYNVIIGLLNNNPYEVFVIPYNKEMSKGFLSKIKKGVYDYQDLDKNFIIQGLSTKMTDEQETITRLISTSLRHGANIKFIVEQLNKTSGGLTGFSKAIARVLKKYIPDGAKSTIICEDCKSKLIFQEGCQKCPSCGKSKC